MGNGLSELEALELAELEFAENQAKQKVGITPGLNKKFLLPTFITGAKPRAGERTIFGEVFERPGASIRAGILAKQKGEDVSQAGLEGLRFPEEVPTFLSLSQKGPLEGRALTGGETLVEKFTNQTILADRFARGLGRDIAAFAGDVLTSPADLFGLLGGKIPIPKGLTPVGKLIGVKKKIPKAIKPGAAGRAASAEQTAKFHKKAMDAIETIVDNKASLQLTDEFGTTINKLPETLDEFSTAIAQTKRAVFNQYDDLISQAGRDTAIDINPVIQKLQAVGDDQTLRVGAPNAITYAEEVGFRLAQEKKYTAEGLDNLIQFYNNKLKAFYANPDPKLGSEAIIDAAVVNNLRKVLDETISLNLALKGKPGAVGKFQALKNRYGALSSIEKDVAKRAFAESKRPGVQLIDYTDIFSVGQIARGIINSSPGAIGSAAAQITLKTFIKNWMSPNKAVKSIFRKVDSIKNPGAAKIIPKATEATIKTTPATIRELKSRE